MPVTPATVSRREGSPQSRAAREARAARLSPTSTRGVPSGSAGSGGRSATTATAPRRTASRAWAWPSVRVPPMATNSVPGAARRESYTARSTPGSAGPGGASSPAAVSRVVSGITTRRVVMLSL